MGKIELDGLTKEYGDIVAVDGVDASFTDGNYTMILGPSGSGKSTLLRMIAGLETPTSGEVIMDGEVVTDQEPKDRDLSMVFQNLALWDHKTVRENMVFGLKMDDVPADEREPRVKRTAELLQIEDKLDANPAALSGGQQQRVALGRSLVREPDVILFDEPLSSLDQRLRLKMRTELRRIQQETGTTFIHVTHNQEDAMTIADEILVLDTGEVKQFATPLDLYHRPANEFVADFIGSPSMNLYDARFVDGEQQVLEVEGGLEIQIGEAASEHFSGRVPEGPVRIGIRPGAINFGERSSTDITINGTVSIVETFGDFNWYYVDTQVDGELVVQSNDDTVMESTSKGDSVTLSVSPAAIHTFNPQTGESYDTAELSKSRDASSGRPVETDSS